MILKYYKKEIYYDSQGNNLDLITNAHHQLDIFFKDNFLQLNIEQVQYLIEKSYL